MSDTPRTEEMVRQPVISDAQWVEADFARQLERELKEARDDYALAENCFRKCQACLREAMTYIESTNGTRGENCGSAVNARAYFRWLRSAGIDPSNNPREGTGNP